MLGADVFGDVEWFEWHVPDAGGCGAFGVVDFGFGFVGCSECVDVAVVGGVFCVVEPVFVGAADAVGDGFGEAVCFGPDDFCSEDEL